MLDIRAGGWTSGMRRKAQDNEGRIAFHYLVAYGDVETTKKFIESIKSGYYSEFTDILDKNNESALHVAARNGDIQMLEMLNNTFKDYTSNYQIQHFFPHSLLQKNKQGMMPIEIAAQNAIQKL